MDGEFDVIIVGGGVAGLQAAAQLGRAGKTVMLLEARRRLGGRVASVRPAGWRIPIELGAEFIHGGNMTMSKLLRRYGIAKHAVGEQHWLVEDGRRREIPDAWDRIDGVMKQIGPRYRKAFGVWLQSNGKGLHPTDRKLAETFVKGFQGAPTNAMSAHTLFEATKQDEEQFRLVGGYVELIRALEKRLPRNRVQVLLGRVVDRIDWQCGHAIVRAGPAMWSAKAVLVTVPLGVLQARPGASGRISFVPALSQREQLWRRLQVGHAMRVILRMRSDVWRRGVVPKQLREGVGEAFGFLHSDEPFFPVWWAEAPHPILVGWTGGPAAIKLAGKSPQAVFKHACKTLSKLLGCGERALARSVVDWRTRNWTSDPFTRGAYSFSIAGLEDAPRRLGKPIERTLFFAGEATADPLELGTVHGALASGDRAAGEIIRTRQRRR